MVRTQERLGEAGVRLPCTGNLTRHFVFQSSYSINKKKRMLLLGADRGLRLRTHAHTPYMSFTRISMHTHQHKHSHAFVFCFSQVHPSIHSYPHMPSVFSGHHRSFSKPFLNELQLVPFFFLVSRMVCSECFFLAWALRPPRLKHRPFSIQTVRAVWPIIIPWHCAWKMHSTQRSTGFLCSDSLLPVKGYIWTALPVSARKVK